MSTASSLSLAAIAAFAAAAIADPLAAQNTNVAARYGSVNLQGDFRPDPHVTNVEAGGSDDAARIGGSCAGFISNDKPDYEINYSGNTGYHLGFYVVGNVDTTLIINGPSGDWFCNDDFDAAGGSNPGVVFNSPENGNYDVWVGVYNQGDTGADVQLYVTEIDAPWLTSSNSGGSGGGGNAGGSAEAPRPSGPPGTNLVSSGTGFLVSRTGHVLTNNHVIEGCTRMTFQLRGSPAVEAQILSSNSATDLGLLATSLTPASYARFRGAASLRLGDEVVVFGFPLTGDLSSQGNLTYGIVSALSGLNDDLSRMQMTAQIQPGNSGGPVMDRSGHIVGVVVETANQEFFRRERGTDTQNLNFAIRDSLARSFLDTNNVRYDVATPAAQQSIADIAEGAQAFTGVLLCYQ